MNISENQKAIFLDVLEKYSNGEICDGCGDYVIDNTPENREFLREMNEAIGDPDDEEAEEYANDAELYTMDWLIMAYFVHLMKNDKL